MVYQHFTLVPSMTVAENLVMSRLVVPAVIDWRKERAALEAFLARMPFKVPLGARIDELSAGERQKTEILKQLWLERKFLILDEPTSVLTPDEADEMLGLLRGMAQRRAAHHPDDHPQVPRGDGLHRRRDRAAQGPARRRAAWSPSSTASRWRR